MSSTLHLVTHGPEATHCLGRLLGRGAEASDVFLLTGTLGAGKTCLTQGIAWGLGVEGYARSPTFIIVNRHQGRLPLYHIDLFRIDDAREAGDLGLDEYLFGENVCVVEWADRAPEVFPSDSLWIAMEYGATSTERLMTIKATRQGHRRRLDGLKGAVGKWENGLALA